MSRHLINPGTVFGKLTVLSRAGLTRFKEVTWYCHCDCGNFTVTKGKALRAGTTQSCGCMIIEVARKTLTKHGLRGSGEYRIWSGLKARCLNPNSPAYPHYGGRGITVCDEWAQSFEAFYRDMGPRPTGKTINRKDNDKGYSKDNCEWATVAEQNKNRSITLPINLKQIAAGLGISYGAAYQRMKRGKL